MFCGRQNGCCSPLLSGQSEHKGARPVRLHDLLGAGHLVLLHLNAVHLDDDLEEVEELGDARVSGQFHHLRDVVLLQLHAELSVLFENLQETRCAFRDTCFVDI